MESVISFENPLKHYLLKQNNFKSMVKNIQHALNSKQYKDQGFSFDEFVRINWNISKAQAYRYLISAKVLDQLEDFYVQPCYERLCRSLYNYAKTPQQMKLLWGTILKKTNGIPNFIKSSHVTRIWKELCNDKKYYNICHFEDEIMAKIDESFKSHSKKMMHSQLNKYSKKNNVKNSPNEPSIVTYPNNINNGGIIYNNENVNSIYPVSPISNSSIISSPINSNVNSPINTTMTPPTMNNSINTTMAPPSMNNSINTTMTPPSMNNSINTTMTPPTMTPSTMSSPINTTMTPPTMSSPINHTVTPTMNCRTNTINTNINNSINHTITTTMNSPLDNAINPNINNSINHTITTTINSNPINNTINTINNTNMNNTTNINNCYYTINAPIKNTIINDNDNQLVQIVNTRNPIYLF